MRGMRLDLGDEARANFATARRKGYAELPKEDLEEGKGGLL